MNHIHKRPRNREAKTPSLIVVVKVMDLKTDAVIKTRSTDLSRDKRGEWLVNTIRWAIAEGHGVAVFKGADDPWFAAFGTFDKGQQKDVRGQHDKLATQRD